MLGLCSVCQRAFAVNRLDVAVEYDYETPHGFIEPEIFYEMAFHLAPNNQPCGGIGSTPEVLISQGSE